VVRLNRRLVQELANEGKGEWEVTAIAPTFFQAKGDLRSVSLDYSSNEPCDLIPVRAFLTHIAQLFFYGTQLRRILAQDWDLVHCWEEPYTLAGGQIAWWTRGNTPLVFWTAQNLCKDYPPPFGWLERYCLARCTGWMACGKSIVETMLPRGYGTKPHRIMPLGVDVQHFRPDKAIGRKVRASLGWAPSGPPVVGFLGRFVPEKGLKLLTQALDDLPTPWRALFVGAGPLESALRKWAIRYDDRVRVCTDVYHDAVPQYLNAMDILCAPSQTAANWKEQFGRMLIEAFACGVPVIGSDSGEIPHVLANGGLVVGENDLIGWRNTLADLLEGPSRREELGAQGLDRARTHFTWPVIARKHLDFFNEIHEMRRAS
jgi:glycosyltransferase involved in cell wall biosynthesis